MDWAVKFARGIAMKWERLHDAAKKSNCYVTETNILFTQSLILKYQKRGYKTSANNSI